MCVQWKGLLPQLFAMDQGLDDMHEHEPNKGSQNVAVYHNTDQFCAGTYIIQYSVHGNYVHSTLAKHSIEMQLVGIVMHVLYISCDVYVYSGLSEGPIQVSSCYSLHSLGI